MLKLLLAASMIVSGATVAESQLSPADASELFSKSSRFFNPKISPGGDYLAIKSRVGGKDMLLVLKTNTMETINLLRFKGNAQIGDFDWVNDERFVVSKEYISGWNDHPSYYGELFAANADGSNSSYLFGYKENDGQGIRGTAYIVDPLINDNDYMLVKTIPWGTNSIDYEKGQTVYKVNVYRGKKRRIATAPVGYSQFLTDELGEIRFASGLNKQDETEIYYREGNKKDWHEQDKVASLKLNGFGPISFAGKDQIYAVGTENPETPRGVYKIDLTNGKQSRIFGDAVVEPTNYWIDQQTKKLYAVELDDGYPSYAFIDNNNPRSHYLKQLLKVLPRQHVRIISETRDGKQLIIFASSDKNPGSYYLLSTETMKMKFLFSGREWLDPEQMAATKPIKFKSRDGKSIEGFVTLPNTNKQSNPPLIVIPHGGPHGVRDYWQFDPENQLLASQGYAVLQINYRGSAGYGDAFEEAGYQQWGTGIQHDIIDGTKYLIQEGMVDPDRICISGGSFGGYSALQSAIIEPSLFKCAIGFAGVYDLNMMYKEGDIQERYAGISYLEKAIGTDTETLKAISPAHNAEKLKAAVMLVHGGKDKRAPIEQYEAMAEALKKANHPFQTLVMDDEGHGFYKDEHRARYYSEMLMFLERHLN